MILAGTDNVIINTNAITGNSKIFLTLKNSESDLPVISVSSQENGKFTVKGTLPKSYDLKFDWWVVN